MQIIPVNSENEGLFKGMLFYPRPLKGEKYLGLGIMDGDMACGTAVVSTAGYGLHLQSLYVKPECRRQGMGGMLLDHIISHAKKNGDSIITVNFMYSDEGMEEFLQQRSFLLTGEEMIYEIPVSKITENGKPEILKKPLHDGKVVSFDFIDKITEMKVSEALKEIDYPYEILKSPEFDRRLSFILTDNSDALQGIMLCTSSADHIMVELLFGWKASPKKLLSILSCFYDRIEKGPNLSRTVYFQEKRENVAELVGKILNINLEPSDFPVFGVLAIE